MLAHRGGGELEGLGTACDGPLIPFRSGREPETRETLGAGCWPVLLAWAPFQVSSGRGGRRQTAAATASGSPRPGQACLWLGVK